MKFRKKIILIYAFLFICLLLYPYLGIPFSNFNEVVTNLITNYYYLLVFFGLPVSVYTILSIVLDDRFEGDE